MNTPERIKPLGHKGYGSIAHLPGSRQGRDDKGIQANQAELLTKKCRPGDTIIVQEKLDGSNVSVARLNGAFLALSRAGYLCSEAEIEQHQWFADWVAANETRFMFLTEGERLVGEWLAQAHSTRYNLKHEPFVAFDIMKGHDRVTHDELLSRAVGFTTPRVLHKGPSAFSIEQALAILEPSGHGAIDPVEGAVWRLESNGRVQILGKYVRPGKVDGYFIMPPDRDKTQPRPDPIWNWTPARTMKELLQMEEDASVAGENL